MAICPTCRTQYEGAEGTCPKDGDTLLPDEAFASADSALAAGAVVGEYRVESKLGEGGFGAVYRAVHPLIGKTAAIKVLNRQYSSNPQMVSRFIAEARAVNQIRHRNIIDIFSFGQLTDGRHYYVMELLDGMPMDEYLRQKGRLSPAEALPILRSIARALDAAHAAGIAHRDLKPENVFLVIDDEGTVFPKLLDFGIAKLLTDATAKHKTQTGTPMGTPYFMSPEQCRGRDVDHRTDVYSFGVMCHQALTGVLPFDGNDTIEILIKQTTQPPPAMSSVSSDLPVELDGPVLHMLEKNPDARPTSLAAAIDELGAAAAALGIAPAMATAQVGSSRRNLSPAEYGAISSAPTLAGPGTQTLSNSAIDTPPKRRLALIGGGALLACGVLVAALFTRTGGTPQPVVPSAPAASVEAEPRPPTPAVAPSASAPTVTVANEIELTIQATPANAEVFLGSDHLGTAPGPFKVKRGDAKLKLTLKAEGYKPLDVEVLPVANASIPATLVRVTAAPARTQKQSGEIENPFR